MRIILITLSALFVIGCSTTKNPSRVIKKNKDLMSDMSYYEGLKQYYIGADNNAILLFNKSISYKPSNDAAYFMLSKIYQVRRDSLNSLKNAKLAYKYDSKNKDYGINYAQILLANRQLDSALAVYKQLTKLDSTDTDILLNMSLIYGYKGDLKQSIKLYDEFSTKFGNNEIVLSNKQKLYLQLNQLDSAIAIGNKLIELYPDDPSHLTMLGDIYANKGNDSLAVFYNKKALELFPTYPLAQIGLSDAYRRMGLYGDYFKTLNQIFKNDEIHNVDKVNYFKQFLENKSFYQVFYPNIDTLINNFVSTYPKDTSIYEIYAEHLTKLGKLSDLNSFLQEKIDNGSKDSTLYTKFIELNFYLKRYDTTTTYSTQAIHIFPKNIKFYLYKSYSLFQTKQYDSTIALLKSALPLVTSDSVKVDLLSMIGDSYHTLGNVTEAFKYYDEALKINPKSIAVLNNYSYYLSLLGKNLPKALKMIDIVLESNPNSDTYLDTKAWILYKMGKFEEAKQVMRKALIYGGNENDTILEHYGDILDKLNDKDAANMYWQMSYNKGNRSEDLLKKLNLK